MDTWVWFQEQAAAVGVPVTDEQRDRFAAYHSLLVKANETTNLTRITEPRDAAVKHYLDSLLFLKLVPADWHERPIRFFDVGTGPGIPGIPLLIMRPHWTGYLVDSVGKKVAFMREAATALDLDGAHPLHGRAEDLGQNPAYRETCDLTVARALAALPELLELTLPFVRPGGKLIVSKGSKGPEELEAAQKALEILKSRLETEATLQLPDEAGERYLYVFDKQAKLPRTYPRKAGIPHRSPLN